MANPEHLSTLKEGLEKWNRWRRGNPDLAPDLSAVDLGSSDLRWFNLSGTNLRRAHLRKADLSWAQLSGANLGLSDLEESNLSEATLTDATFREAYCKSANFRSSSLIRATFTGTYLRGADLSAALLNGTTFAASDLSEATGLMACKHSGPSFVDYHTLVKSGTLPLMFLRGCGLADSFIEYLPSLFNQAVHFYSCFISYSTKDQDFADRLYADLQNTGVRCWFAPNDIAGGRKIHEQIDEAIRLHDKLLLILSPNSMNSNWVKTEIANAREREQRERRQMLFPLGLLAYDAIRAWKCFDADTGIDSAREIREYFIPDFSNWKDHDEYQRAFQRLLKDLKAHGDQGR